MLEAKELEERYRELLNYCHMFRLGGSNSSEHLHQILVGRIEDFQRKLGIVEPGNLIFKFMVECPDPRLYPRDYKALLYYNKENLSKLIERASYKESYDEIFGYEPAKVSTENEIKRNYQLALRKFKEDYNLFKTQSEPIYDIYTSFTSEPSKIDVGYFFSKDACSRVLVNHATNQNIFMNNRSGLGEYEVFDIVTKESFVKILSFDEWLTKYSAYSIAFKEYQERTYKSGAFPIQTSADFTDEELEIVNIMNKVLEEGYQQIGEQSDRLTKKRRCDKF